MVPLLLLAGCGSPSRANIALRKQIQSNENLIENLKRQHDADVAQIRGLQGNPSPSAALPPEQLGKLFTTHGIKFGRLTGGADLDPGKPGDEALKVQVTPFDDDGDNLKAAGSFVIDAFDLNKSGGDNRLGHWEFSTDEARKNWSSVAFLYGYLFTLPWQHGPPEHAEVTLKVTFTDALTGRVFDAQKRVRVELPPPGSENPTSAPSTSVARP